jgi:hypothetical protein
MGQTNQENAVCPGCGLILPNQQVESPNNYNASGECYQKYNELTFYTIGKQDIHFIHQHAVDAYAAQHSGGGMKPITTAFALIGLYYAIERGFNGRQVQRVHTKLARQKYSWVPLEGPKKSYSLTVRDVLDAPSEERDALLRKWMSDVWECWDHQHNWVREICETFLNNTQ